MILLYIVHVLLCLFLILVVLLQQGKGADLSVFGGGATMTAFGARSATTLLHRLTVGAFVGFVVTTLVIAYAKSAESGTLMRPLDTAPATAPATPAAPATTAPAAPTAGNPAEPAATPAGAAPESPAPAQAAPVEPPPAAAEPPAS